MPDLSPARKIIHVDMDCFFAAIEMRERPELAGLPVAVGGSSGRGVLTTCNYAARAYGCRSAMPSFKALQLCPDLILLPVRFDLYREVSQQIRQIFSEFTSLVEPLSLDEAYLDVSHLRSEARSIAWEIRDRIQKETGLTASAGIAPNKFLAKIASDWRKPDGQFEVLASEALDFLTDLTVRKIWGVGEATSKRLEGLGIHTCADLRRHSEWELLERFGKFGQNLYQLCRGIDERSIHPDRERKSLSNERTFHENLASSNEGQERLDELVSELQEDYTSHHRDRRIRECVVKLKFADFQVTSAQRAATEITPQLFSELLNEAWDRSGGRAVRLIGAGVRFVTRSEPENLETSQLELALG